MKRRLGPSLVSIAIILVFAVIWLLIQDKNIAVLQPKGLIANQQKELILFTVGLGMLVVIPVFVMLFGFMYKYKASNTKATYMPDVEGNKKIEAIWWGIPVVIIAILSVVTFVSTHQLDPYKAIASTKEPLKVQVVSLQWRWLFLYPNEKIATINELRMPVDRPVEFSISADSPMSAFWIPNLGSQTYAMNGMSSKLHLQADTIGEYRGSNSNISGKGYAKMNFKAVVSSADEFDRWKSTVAQSANHLDWSSYQQIAKENEDGTVQYFMLHDTGLYDAIMNKYMGHGGMNVKESNEHEMNHEGMHH